MKKCIVICMTALSLSCVAAGCGKEESKAPENNYQVETINMENSADKNTEASDDDTIASGKEDQADSGAAGDDIITPGKEDQAAGSGAAGSNEEQAEGQADYNTGQKKSESGIIKEITEQYISVSLSHEGDINGEIIYSIDDENPVKVYYDENTVFNTKTVKNNGIDPANDVTVTKASPQDMKTDMMINLEGEWDGDIYHADVVNLYQFL